MIIGSPDDPHVQAVAAAVDAHGVRSLMLDVSTLSTVRWRRSISHYEVFSDGEWQRPNRGWLRRLAPPRHHQGIEFGSLEAVEAGSRLQLIVSLADTGIEWLTDYWRMLRAENKLVQYKVAQGTHAQVPATVVATDAADIDAAFGAHFVVKPLGLGEYYQQGTPFAVHAQFVARADPVLRGLSVAPYIAQQRIFAVSHLRIVTVGQQAWAALLPADGLPLDWRLSERAHMSWSPTHAPEVAAQALLLASALGLGYSSQDWIVDQDGMVWFVDANPGGQWLFLPETMSRQVTAAIASWLIGGNDYAP